MFDKWYTESTFENLYDFDTLVNKDIFLKGRWKKLKHTATVNLLLDGKVYGGHTVELYQDYEKKYELTETATAGTYRLADAVETGVYDIYVDGSSIYATIDVAGKKTEKDLSSEQLSAMVSGESTTADIEMVSLKTVCLLDGEPANVGEVYYRDEMADKLMAQYVSDTTGRFYFAPTSVLDTRVQDIFVNGADSDRLGISDAAKDISVASPSKVLNFYKMAFVVDIDDSTWTSNNVVLRDKDGNFVAQLNPESYDSTNGTRTFAAIMPKDEKATPDEYTVYLDGADTKIVLTATESGHTKTVAAYRATVNVKKDGAAWNDAVVMISNEEYSYTLFDGGTSGKYETALLYDANEEKPYSVSVNASIDQSTNSLSSSSKQIDMNFYSVKYYSYKKGSTDGTYELESSKAYREQTVRFGGKALQVAEPYVEGLTFRCFSKEQWTIGETPVSAYDFETPVSEPLILYAHFENPEININGFVKSSETGEVSSTGEYFVLPNLTISGFDEGGAIKSILITVSNVESVTFPTEDGVSVNSKDGTHAITFAEKVSMTEAQVYLRSAVFKPIQEKEINLSITVSDGIIDASSETSFTQTQVADNWTKLSSVLGYNTITTNGLDLSAGNYYVDESVTITNTSAGGSGLRINGNVNLYIPQGVVLTANGAAGSGTTGGGAGVYLPSGKNLYLYGEGTLKAYGGKGGNGAVGDDGQDSSIVVNGSSKTERYFSTHSGKGGNGGGGGGAGIGTNGATGADGGASVGLTDYKSETEHLEGGKNGKNGSAGLQAYESGNVYYNGVTVNAVKGGAGDPMSTYSSKAGASATFSNNWQYWMGASGGGGNGAPGRAGNDIGAGGSSGAGGGAGGSGAITGTSDPGAHQYATTGGHGGNADGSAGRTDGNTKGSDSKKQTAGNGGKGGTTPANRTAKSLQSCATLAGYTVTFVGAQGSPSPTSYALNSQNVVVNVPEYTPESGKFFLGWRVSKYAKNVDGQSDTRPLTTAETKLYQPGESITLAERTYGNIELKPVTIEIAGKTDTDKLSIPDTEFVPSAPAINYYVYSVVTKLDGVSADIGTLVLKNGSESLTLGGNGTGEYSLTTSVENTAYSAFVNNEDTGVTVECGTPAQINAKSIQITTEVNGVPSSKPGDVTLVAEDTAGNLVAFSTAAVLSDGNPTGVYRVRRPESAATELEYSIYVDGKDTGKSVVFSSAETVDFYGFTVNVTGNVTADSILFRASGENDILLEKVTDGTYTGIGPADGRTCEIYVNGLASGCNAEFTDAAEKIIDINIEALEAVLRVDGTVSDETGFVPLYNGGLMQKTAVGTYSVTVFGNSIGKAVVNGNEMSFESERAVFDYYTVTYKADDTGVEGNVPTDARFYLKGTRPAVAENVALSRSGCQLQGWTVSGDASGTVYGSGDVLPAVYSPVILEASWRDNATYPITVVMNDEILYVEPDELQELLEERNYPAEGDGKPGMTIIVKGYSGEPDRTVVLPEGIYLGPDDEMIIESSVQAEVKNFTNEGELTIEEGTAPASDAKLDISGTFENRGNVVNKGIVELEPNTEFKNAGEAAVENDGELIIGDTAKFINNGELLNNENGTVSVGGPDGIFENDGNAVFDNEGVLDVNGSFENNAEVVNNGSLISSSTTGNLENNRVITGSGSGTIELPISNEDGMVLSGTLKAPGSITGGVVMGMDTSQVPNAVQGTKDSISGVSSTPAAGGPLPAIASGTDPHPTQSDIDSVFGAGNALLAVDEEGKPLAAEDGSYVILLKNGVELENPLEIPDGVSVTIELAGSRIVGPDGETAINVTGGSLTLFDSIGSGGVEGGRGTIEGGGNGDGGCGIEVTGNGKLNVDSDVEVSGGPGVGQGRGGTGIRVDLDSEGTGEVRINGTVSGGSGGSDTEGTSGNGGSGLEIENAPEGKVILESKAGISGGEGGSNVNGTAGTEGEESEIAPAAVKSLFREPAANDDKVEIVLVNKLYANGESQEQKIIVKADGEVVSETDYTVERNTATDVGDYILKVSFNYDIDSAKAYSGLALKIYNKEFTIYKAPVPAPEVLAACTIDYENERVVPKADFEISEGTQTGYVSEEIDIEFGKTYYLRKMEDSIHGASEDVSYTPVRPATPSAPSIVKRTDDCIEVTTIQGQEYSLDGKNWQDTGIFTGLTPEKEYSIITRVKATTASFRSLNSQAAAAATKSSAKDAPAVTLADMTVTSTGVTLPTAGTPNTYEYSTDGKNWTEVNEYTDLTPATAFTYYVRVKETDTAMPSEGTKITGYTAAPVPEEGEGYKLNYQEESITVETGYEISTVNNPFKAEKLTDGRLAMEPATTYYIRPQATEEGVPAPEAADFTTPARPATPSAPSELKRTDTTIEVSTVSGQEYSLDGKNWQDGGSFTGLASDTEYSVITRVKSVGSAFRSPDSEAVALRTKTAPDKAPDVSLADTVVKATSVILPVSGEPNVFEYSADGENWSDNNAYTNLVPDRLFRYYVRVKETDTSMPSKVQTITGFTPLLPKEEKDKDPDKEPDNGQEDKQGDSEAVIGSAEEPITATTEVIELDAVKDAIDSLVESGEKKLVISTVKKSDGDGKTGSDTDGKTDGSKEENAVSEQLSISADVLEALKQAESIKAVEIKTEVADIKLSSGCIEALDEKIDGQVTIVTTRREDVEVVKAEDTKASAGEAGKAEPDETEGKKYVSYEVSITDEDGKKLTSLDGEKIKVTVPIPESVLDMEPVCVFTDGKGHYAPVKAKVNKDGTMTFTTTHLNEFIIMPKEEAEASYNSIYDLQTLRVYETETTDSSIKISWDEYEYADGYVVYASLCNGDGHKHKVKKVATIKNPSVTDFTLDGLESGEYYKLRVKAYMEVDGKYVVVKSYLVHAKTTVNGKNGTEAIKVDVKGIKNNSLSLKKKETFKIKAKQYDAEGRKIKHADLRYESSDPSVATVSKDGVITAVGKGTCSIFVFAENGIYEEITVKVKKK